MFTGIVQGTRSVTAVEEFEGGRRLRIQLDNLAGGLKRGASVAVNGTCLTATDIQDGWVEFDVIAETLRCTNLGSLWSGDLVNIERSAKVGDEIGGHHVSGHIDGTGMLREIRDAPNNREVVVEHDLQWQQLRIARKVCRNTRFAWGGRKPQRGADWTDRSRFRREPAIAATGGNRRARDGALLGTVPSHRERRDSFRSDFRHPGMYSWFNNSRGV